MRILFALFIGFFLAGVRMVLPEPESRGVGSAVATLALGMIGAAIGGAIGQALGWPLIGVASVTVMILSALVVLTGYDLVSGWSDAHTHKHA